MTSFTELSDKVKEYCLENGLVSETVYNLWISPLEAMKFENNTAYFYVKSPFQKTIIILNYEKILKEAFLNILGFEVNIEIKTEDDYIDPKENQEKSMRRQEELEKSYENAEYDFTFDTFIVGKSNQFAYATCTAVANSLKTSSEYNPLFIHGSSGLGKTHLLNAVENRMKQNNPNINIIKVSAENFSNELISAIIAKNTNSFHEKYRNADVLLIDDIQFIAGKESTQEEFFHTFNELYKLNKQIVLTSDRPPKDIKTLEDRIRTRFESGIMADISAPDFETRMAIIRRKAALLDINIPEDVAEFIANRLKTNIRQLEGAVKKFKALKTFAGSSPSIAMAQSVIRDILSDSQPTPITVEKIITEVATIYNVSSEDIRSSKRSSQIVTARKVAAYVIRQITEMSYDAIGTEFGGKDHSTIMHSIKKVEESMKKDYHLKEIVEDLINNIQNN